MNERIKELAKKSGFMLWEDEAWKPKDAIVDWSCNYDAELEKFVKLIAENCAQLCGSQADKKVIRAAFDIPMDPDVKYEAPPIHGSITSQYNRKYNLP